MLALTAFDVDGHCDLRRLEYLAQTLVHFPTCRRVRLRDLGVDVVAVIPWFLNPLAF